MNAKCSLFLLLIISLLACSCTSSTATVTEGGTSAPIKETKNDGKTKYGYTLVDGMDLQESERGILFIFDRPVNFQLSSSKVERIYDESFDVFGEFVNRNSDKIIRIIVEGHTDNSGSRSFNTKLSRNRSLSSVNRAAGSGVSRTIIRNTYVADMMPIYYGKEAYKNRRAEFIIMGSEEDIAKYNNFMVTVQ